MVEPHGGTRHSGYVMAAVSQGQAAEQFTSCSVADLSRFFQEVYAKSPGGFLQGFPQFLGI
jgi:hypothetical protein